MSGAAIGAAVIGTGMSYGLSQLNKGKGGGQQAGGGITPHQVMSMPTFPWQAPTLKSGADFVQQGLRNLTEGKLPEWWNKFQQPIRRGMERGVNQAFYGSKGLGGPRGIFDQIRSAGALTGVGPKATVSNTNKAAQSYADKRSQIEEYLAGQSLAFGQSQSEKLPWMAAQIGSISPPAQVVGGQSYNTPAQQNPWSGALSSLGGSLAGAMANGAFSQGGMTGGYDYAGQSGQTSIPGSLYSPAEVGRMPSYAQNQFNYIPSQSSYSSYRP